MVSIVYHAGVMLWTWQLHTYVHNTIRSLHLNTNVNTVLSEVRSARSPCQNQGLQQKLHCWPFSHGMVSFKDYMQLLCLSLRLASTWRCFQPDLLYSSILSMVGGDLKPGSNVTAKYILHGFRFNQLWGVFPLKHSNLRVDSVMHANIL